MKVVGRYSKSFYSDRLSNTKYREIYDFAVIINKIKNEVSEKTANNLFSCLGMSKFDFRKLIMPELKTQVHSNFDKQLIDEVYTAYHNKFDGITKKLRFCKITDYHFSYYKRQTQQHNIGDFKGVSKKEKSTPLTITLTYLVRYGNENTLMNLSERFIRETDSELEVFYATILDYIYKYGFGRLMSLALSKRDRIIKKHSEHPIRFNSKTFRGRSRLKQDIISYNTNFNSEIKAFINMSWGVNGRKKLSLPVKYDKDFHKNMKRYTNGTDTSYTLCFEDGRIRVALSYDDDREFPENKTNFVGIDVNSKHNLLQCSNGDTIDFDRQLVETLSRELLIIDNLKSKNKDYIIGKRRDRKIKHLNRELRSKIREEIASLCKRLEQSGFDHAVFENLTGFEEKCFCKDENNLNYNRRVKLLKLSSIKDEFEHIARKYGLAVSLVHSCYTSQMCPVCRCIDGKNRRNQEEFVCINCGHIANADLNASKNILERVVSTVLRDELLKKSKLDNGTFEPKTLKRDKVKEVLLSFRYGD